MIVPRTGRGARFFGPTSFENSGLVVPDLSLDLRYLRYAMLVSEYGSFRRAADAIALSQSTLSRRVLLLERRLGFPLFERTRTGTRLTPVGELFIRDAALGAEHLRRAITTSSLAHRGDFGRVRLGLVGSLSRGFLAEAMEAYRRRYPDVDVSIEEGTSQAVASSVLSSRLDAAVIPGEPKVPGCKVENLWVEPLYAILPAAHKLAGCEQALWEELRDERWIVCADGHGPDVEDIIVRELSRLGFRPQISIQQVGRHNLTNMVAKGFGLTLMAGSALGASYPGVDYVPVRGATVSWSLVWEGTNCNAVFHRFLDLIQDRIRQRFVDPFAKLRN